MHVPKLLWITIKDKNNIDETLRKNIENISKMNPSYYLNLIDNNDFENILKNNKPEWLPYYHKLNKKFGAMIADYIRYCLLYIEGGVYIDSKSYCRLPFDYLIKNDTKAIFFQWETIKVNEYLNYFLISAPRQLVYLNIIETINKNIDNYNPNDYNINHSKNNILKFTGPHFIKPLIDLISSSDPESITIKNNNFRKKALIYGKVKDHVNKFGSPHYSKVKEHLVN